MENIGKSNKTYRIRTDIDAMKSSKIDVQLTQHFDILEILSLKIKPTNMYQLQQSNYGVVVGRVVANGGFGVPNAKVSIFIPVKEGVGMDEFLQYSYTSPNDSHNGIRYNVLPDEVQTRCHQDVGTLPSKTYMLDNNVIMQVFKDYYTLTTSTNSAGDYMLFGVPTGDQELHMDVDLSDIGLLSQTPRDMIYKGYNLNLFDSPTKFKSSGDLDSLPQLQSQTKSIYVYPYWGETNEMKDNIAITRCDIQLAYEFEPTCVFIGSAVGDRASNAIGKKCIAADDCGKMSELVASEGSIEMIRFNINGNVEEYPIMGNRLIDGDGTWCYQIPMNLDYVTTDEFGNTVPTDDPTKGIPTRAKVRFRVSMDETGEEGLGRKKARYLIPHNPASENDVDYKFGSETREESFIDLLWNKVYSVKSYIPRLEKSRKQGRKRIAKTREHTGIKAVNHNNGKNPIPYNNITMKLNFGYRFRCVMLKVMITLLNVINTISWFLNTTLMNAIVMPIIGVMKIIKGVLKIFGGGDRIQSAIDKIKAVMDIPYASLDAEFCMLDDDKPVMYVPVAIESSAIVQSVKNKPRFREAQEEYDKVDVKLIRMSKFNDSELAVCVETQLAEENEVVFYNFYNDWLNGCLYFPLWFRKFKRPRKLFFGLIKTKGIDRWCSDEKKYKFTQRETCDLNESKSYKKPNRLLTDIYELRKASTRFTTNKGYKGNVNKGLVHVEKTMLDELVYYYNANWFKTDIVLLGSMDDYDRNGIPQFFKYLPITTYQKPNSVRMTDPDDENVIEMAGENWALSRKSPDYYSTGLFYQLACSDSRTLMLSKTCVNVKRVCELGVDVDQRYQLENGSFVESDGLITQQEIINDDIRAMFATMNDYDGNTSRLSVIRNNDTSMMEYQFLYSYGQDFDYLNWGERVKSDNDYKIFRGGGNNNDVTQRKNSFYFYFGLNEGKTAIEKFNSQFYADCGVTTVTQDCVVETVIPDWCVADKSTNQLKFKISKSVSYPINVLVKNMEDDDIYCDLVFSENDLNGTKDSPYLYLTLPLSGKTADIIEYADYVAIVTDSESNVVYDNVIHFAPDTVDVKSDVLAFNVSNEKLSRIFNETIKQENADITYNGTDIVSGTGAIVNVYPYGHNLAGKASRKVNINGKQIELGGSVALRLEEGVKSTNCIVNIKGDRYDKTYDSQNIGKITHKYTEQVNDDEEIEYDVVCLFVPYPGKYEVSVKYLCPGQIETNGYENIWEGIVNVGEYKKPVVTFEDSTGVSMTMQQVNSFIGLVGGINAFWGEILNGGGILDIMVDAESNPYYKRLCEAYGDKSSSGYRQLVELFEIDELQVLEEITEDMTELEKQEIKEINRQIEENNIAIDENNKQKLRDLLVSFYQLFSRIQDMDGLEIKCSNEVADCKITNVAYRQIEDGNVKRYLSNQTLDYTVFNKIFSDFSSNEAFLYNNGFGSNAVVAYDADKSYKMTCTLSDLLGDGSMSTDFYLFDNRMKITVVSVSNLYKYENGSETDVERTYYGNLEVSVEKGFLPYTVVNLYDNWAYDKDSKRLYPIDSKGEPLNGDLEVEYNPAECITANPVHKECMSLNWGSNLTADKRHKFTVRDEIGMLVVSDGNGNTLTVNGINNFGECAVGIGGMLLMSEGFVGKGSMKENYGEYVPSTYQEMWTDADITYNANGCVVRGKWRTEEDKKTNGGNCERRSYTLDTSTFGVKGYFRNWVTGNQVNGTMASYRVTDLNPITNYTTTDVTNIYFCDSYLLICNDAAKLKDGHTTGDEGEIFLGGANLPWFDSLDSNIDFGLYFTWSVKWGHNDDGGFNNFFDSNYGLDGFYVKKGSGEAKFFLNKDDEDSLLSTNASGNMYFLELNNKTGRRVHWLQNVQSNYRLMKSELNIGPLEIGNIQSDRIDDGCYKSVEDVFNNRAFYWANFEDMERIGYARQMRTDRWVSLKYVTSTENRDFACLGVIITTSSGQVTRQLVSRG